MQLAKRYPSIVSVGSMIVILVAARFFDNLVHGLRRNGNLDGEIYFKHVLLSMWLIPILFFLLAVCLLALFWFVINQEKRNIVIPLVFITVGICILFLPPLSYSVKWTISVPLFMDWPVYDSRFFLGTSVFVMAIGAMSILFPKQGWN